MCTHPLHLQKRGALKGQVDLTKVKAIEKVQDGTFDKPSFQVITPSPLLLLDDILSEPDIIIYTYHRSGNFCVNKLSYDKFLCIKTFVGTTPYHVNVSSASAH